MKEAEFFSAFSVGCQSVTDVYVDLESSSSLRPFAGWTARGVSNLPLGRVLVSHYSLHS